MYIKGNQTVSEFENLWISKENKMHLEQNKEIYIQISEVEFYHLKLVDKYKWRYKKPVIITPIMKIDG